MDFGCTQTSCGRRQGDVLFENCDKFAQSSTQLIEYLW